MHFTPECLDELNSPSVGLCVVAKALKYENSLVGHRKVKVNDKSKAVL